MIEELAIVLEVSENKALVETEVKTTCGSCAKKSDCGTSAIAKAFANKKQAFWLDVDESLVTGDTVRIGIKEDTLLRISFLLYLLPLFALFTGVMAVALIFPSISELWQLSAGVLLAYVCFRYLGRQYTDSQNCHEFMPHYLGKVPKDESWRSQIDVKLEH